MVINCFNLVKLLLTKSNLTKLIPSDCTQNLIVSNYGENLEIRNNTRIRIRLWRQEYVSEVTVCKCRGAKSLYGHSGLDLVKYEKAITEFGFYG